jgi:HlyD family secretion protein
MHAVHLTMTFLGMFILMAGCGGEKGNVIEASGTIEGTEVNIGAEVPGRITEVRVEEGARVTPGDTLMVIDPTEYRLQLRQAIANRESFAAAYRLAREGFRKEDVRQAEAAFKTAGTDYARMKDLLASSTVTQKQYDEAYTRFVTAEQTHAKMVNGSRPEEVDAARVRLELASAQVELTTKKLNDCVVRAHAAGIVTLRSVEPGELVSFGSHAFRLTRLDRVYLMIYPSESEIGRIRLGQQAAVTIDAYGDARVFPGRVVYVSPTAEFTPKNIQTREERTKLVFAVKIEVDNPDGALKPGLPADARIETAGMEHQ